MDKEFSEILDRIQYAKGITLDELAQEIGYSRQSLQAAKNKGGSHKLLFTIRETYKDILKTEKVHTSPSISNIATKNESGINLQNKEVERLKQENARLEIENKFLKEMIDKLLEKR